MADEMTEKIKAEINMRVNVFAPDKRFIGLGTIINVESLMIEETGEELSKNFPTIKLDSGKILTGLECFWYPKFRSEES